MGKLGLKDKKKLPRIKINEMCKDSRVPNGTSNKNLIDHFWRLLGTANCPRNTDK